MDKDNTENNNNNATPSQLNESNVANAVVFLRHPSAKNEPTFRKIEFLKHKGLSQQEIDEAFLRAGIAKEGTQDFSSALISQNMNQGLIVSGGIGWRGMFAGIFTVFTVIAALFKWFVGPWIAKYRQQREAQSKRLEDLATLSKKELVESVQKLCLEVREVVATLKESSAEIDTKSFLLRQSEDKVRRLQAELNSLRASTLPTTPLKTSQTQGSTTEPTSSATTTTTTATTATTTTTDQNKQNSRDKYVPGRAFASSTSVSNNLNQLENSLGNSAESRLSASATQNIDIPAWQLVTKKTDDAVQDLTASTLSSDLESSTIVQPAPYSQSFVDIATSVSRGVTPSDVQVINDLPQNPNAPVVSTAPPPRKPWEQNSTSVAEESTTTTETTTTTTTTDANTQQAKEEHQNNQNQDSNSSNSNSNEDENANKDVGENDHVLVEANGANNDDGNANDANADKNATSKGSANQSGATGKKKKGKK